MITGMSPVAVLIRVIPLLFVIGVPETAGFVTRCPQQRQFCTARSASETDEAVSSYNDTAGSSKGLVSGLTGLVNFFFPSQQKKPLDLPPPPQSPEELLERIRDDYVQRNYLWTGDIDLACFNEQCKYTDPTISFTSRDTFVRNTANLKVVVDLLTEPNRTQSDLLDISVTDQFVQTRWNMLGDLTGLPWKPRIDVIGRTKFWYRQNEQEGGLQVYEYDEQWEIPAGKALLQLITPAREGEKEIK